MTPRYFFWDTETTGATPEDKVVELAFIEVDEHLNELTRGHSLIDPERRISPGASGVHGITYDMVADSPTIEEYFQQVLQPPLEGEIVFIAHKAEFDRRYLTPHLPPIVAQVCTLRLARRALPNADNHKLSTLMYQYGLDRGESHSADGDVRTMLSLVRYVLSLPGFEGKTLRHLAIEDSNLQVLTEMPFGKWKGPMNKVCPKYAKWAVTGGMKELDRDLHYTLTLRAEGKI